MGIKSLGRNDLKWLLYYVEKLGGHWLPGLDHDQRESVRFIEDLPIVLSVGDGERRFNVVHAQFGNVNGKVITDASIDQLAKTGMSANTRATCLWGRSLIKMQAQTDETLIFRPRTH